MIALACLWLCQDAASHAEAGLRKFRQGDLEAAAAEYSKAVELDPKDANYRAMRAEILGAKGDLDGAIQDYTALAELTGDGFTWLQKRAEAKASKKDLAGAIEDYTRAIRSAQQGQAGLEKAYAYRGWYRLKADDPKGAIEDYTSAIKLEPGNSNHYNNRGNAWRALGKLKEAIDDFTRAIELSPEFAHPYHNRGLCRFDRGEMEAAIADQSKAVDLKPKYAEAYYCRGLAHQERGEFDAAIEDLTRVLDLDPAHVSARIDRGECKRFKRDYAGAIADQTEAIRAGDADAWEAKAYAEYESEAWEASLASFRRVADRDRCRWRIWILLARLGKKEDAQKALGEDDISKFLSGRLTAEELLKVEADPSRANFYIGMKLLLSGDKAQAIQSLRKCRGRRTPENTSAEFELRMAER